MLNNNPIARPIKKKGDPNKNYDSWGSGKETERETQSWSGVGTAGREEKETIH